MDNKFNVKAPFSKYAGMSKKDKVKATSEFLINNSLYIFMIAAIVIIQIINPMILSVPSIINII